MRSLSVSILCTCLTIACGDEDVPPTPTPSSPRATVQPVDDASGVSIVAPIRVTLSHALTSALGAATATLIWDRGVNEIVAHGTVVDGTLGGSGTALTFTPAAPLTPGMTYRFSLSGLTTAAGAVPAVSVRFRTWADPIDRTISYSADGVISQVVVHSYDASQALLGSTTYNAPGVDGTWLTADDVQSARTVYSELRDGHWTRMMHYTGAGADGVWDTADDVLGYHQLRTFDAAGQLVTYNSYASLGPDNQPFTGDETYSFRHHREYDAAGLMTRYTSVTGAGTDGEWFTADDVANSYTTYTYDATGHLTRASYHARGLDNAWFTADDEVTGYNGYGLLADGRRETENEYAGSGTDTLWYTADDVSAGEGTWVYDTAEVMITETWRDDQAVITNYSEFDHDADGRRTAQRRYTAGTDGDFMTGDDWVQVEWSYVTP